MITDVPGVLIGHWTGKGTGVTTLLFRNGAVGSCEVRGGSPATRETALLEPLRTVDRVDAIVLTGGSAFGLSAADGVLRALAEHGIGFATRGGAVPIVPTAAIYDLVESDNSPPGPEEGRMALAAAFRPGDFAPFVLGRVGAGTGASVGKWRGQEHSVPGGVGSASARDGEVVVGAVAVVNALGDIIGADGQIIAGSTAPDGAPGFPDPEPFEHTTLVAVATNARLTKQECRLLAESAHDGLARSIHPAHTRHDGDIAFAISTGVIDEAAEAPQLDRLRVLATEVTAEAVRSAVT